MFEVVKLVSIKLGSFKVKVMLKWPVAMATLVKKYENGKKICTFATKQCKKYEKMS